MRRGWSSPAGAAGRPRGQSAHCAPAARGRRVGSGAPRQPRGSRPLPRAPGPALPMGVPAGVPMGVPLGRLNAALALLGAVPHGDPVPLCAPAPRGLPGAATMGPESGAGGSCSLVGLGTGRLPAPPPWQGRRQQLFHRLNLTRPWPRARPAGAGAEAVFVGRRDAKGSAVGSGGEAPDELLGPGLLCPACAKPCHGSVRGSPRHSRHPRPHPQLPAGGRWLRGLEPAGLP